MGMWNTTEFSRMGKNSNYGSDGMTENSLTLRQVSKLSHKQQTFLENCQIWKSLTKTRCELWCDRFSQSIT